jgi:hypothetical protein
VVLFTFVDTSDINHSSLLLTTSKNPVITYTAPMLSILPYIRVLPFNHELCDLFFGATGTKYKGEREINSALCAKGELDYETISLNACLSVFQTTTADKASHKTGFIRRVMGGVKQHYPWRIR